MKVLLSWLQEFAPVAGDPGEIGDQLSELGLAVEAVTTVGADLDGVVVARVLELRPHPDADRIQLVDVDAGDGEALQICCGAFNMSVGDLVPLATLGTTMPNGMEIARRKMRGEWSNGMLCAADEIGLGTDGEGILVLGTDHELGRPLAEALELRPTCSTTWRSTRTGPTPCRWPGWPETWRLAKAYPSPALSRHRTRREKTPPGASPSR
tara:strand:+ start:578 stop:1207 length:630 start_codon:yes stop_codon:yes gene_type:complete